MNVDALVIREMSVGESDKLLTLLTREFGVIKAFSSGAKNIGSKKFSASTLLSYANFSLVKVNDTYKIYEATSICSFFSAVLIKANALNFAGKCTDCIRSVVSFLEPSIQ